MTDNVGTINGYTYQSIYQNRILADANLFRSTPSADGLWNGWTGAGCAMPCANGTTSCAPSGRLRPIPGRFERGVGGDMLRAAFVFLLTGDGSYATPVANNLRTQIATPGTNWANTSKWCPNTGGNFPIAFENTPWIVRLLLAYDYLRAGGYTGFTAQEQANIESWFTSAATFWHAVQATVMGWSGYGGVYAEPQDLTCGGTNCTQPQQLLYQGGPTARVTTYNWFMGQMAAVPILEAAVGAAFDNATYQTYAKKWATAYLRAGIWDNGAVSDFGRWVDHVPGSPGSMWGHTGTVVSPMTFVIDILGRTGDTSLYALSAPTLVPGGSGGTVSWLSTLDLLAKMANRTVLLYGASVQPSQLLTWNNDAGCCGNYYDFSGMVGNLYYQDADITTAMTRQALAANITIATGTLSGGCHDSQYAGCWSGGYGLWPDLPYMYGNMQGVVDPFDAAQNVGPTLSITTPTPYASLTVSGNTLTVSGPATDDVGVTGVTWSCPNCPTPTGTASCAPACGASTMTTTWTIANLALPPDSQTATLTVTATDGTLPAPDILNIRRQDSANLLSGLELHYPFSESAGTTTADLSGQNHTGTLETGATFGAGETGNGVVLNGTTGQVTVPSSLTSPAALSLAAWVNLSGGSESATVVNIANAVGMRIHSPNTSRAITGFYYAGGSSWPNLQGGTAFPASGWHHLAYTIDSTRQVLYLDGLVIAMGAGVASGPNYSTGNTTTSLGRNPVDALWDLQGTLDDVRVYTRALSEVDVAALVTGGDPVEPSIQITAPNSGTDTTVNTSPMTTLAGTATDSDGTVTSVVVSCVPSCGSPTVTGVADWSVASLPLAYGRNIVTVTVTDDDTQTNSDTITITRYCPTDISAELELWLDLNGDGIDSSGAGRHGTPSGGVTWGAGVVGSGAAVLNGTTGALTVNSLLDTPATVTISAWIFPTGFPTPTGEIVSIGDYAALRVTASQVAGLTYAGSNTWHNTISTLSLQGGWHHVAFVAMPSLQQLYVDGVAVGTPTTFPEAISYAGLGPTTEIGRWAYDSADGNYFQGSLDDVRVYGCPHDAAGIATIEDYAEGPQGSADLSAPLHLRLVQ